MIKVLQIVPGLPPNINGVGDYALNLARPLYENHGILTEFIVGNPSWRSADRPGYVENFKATPVQARAATALLELLDKNDYKVVILHYVGYGYAKRGCPFWLVQGIRAWAKRPSNKLITMFHELYAKGPIWSSAYWTSSIQKNIMSYIFKISDISITNSEIYYLELETLRNHRQRTLRRSPVFSNIGELGTYNPVKQRKRNMIIFGSAKRREDTYENFSSRILDICESTNIEKILDVGSVSLSIPSKINSIPIEQLGILNSKSLSEQMSESIIGVVDYSARHLGKSTIFAAYCAHGLFPILTNVSKSNEDGLILARNYWDINDCRVDENTLERVSYASYEWYRQHNLTRQASQYAKDIFSLLES